MGYMVFCLDLACVGRKKNTAFHGGARCLWLPSLLPAHIYELTVGEVIDLHRSAYIGKDG